MRKVIRIILFVIFAAIIIVSICTTVKLEHNLKLEEMAAQIEQFGFYKNDLWISVEREKLEFKYTANCLVYIFSSIIGIAITAIWCVCDDK